MPESKLIQGISLAAQHGRLAHPRPTLGLALVPVFVMACSGAGDGPATRNGDDPGQLTDIQGPSVLKRGDVGPGVAAATAFFTKYGYFENDDLRLTYPAWRPVVGPAPANDAVFGDELKQAVEAFQLRSNLPVTGEIDAATRSAMNVRFCGVPDSFESDQGEKWAHDTNVDWQTSPVIKWSMVNNPAPPTPTTITPAQARTIIQGAFAAWDFKTNLTFQRDDANPNPDISVSWVNRTDNILGIGTPTAIFITNSSGWGTAAQNLSTVVGHEVGHAIGLAHSTIKGPGGAVPMMFGSVDTSGGTTLPVVPTADDIFAVDASPYTTFQPAFGGEASATDIGSSIAGGTEYTWKIGAITADSNGFRIYRWRSGSADWQQINGGAVRIDVAGMVPWVVSANGVVWEKTGVTASNPNGTGWGSRGNCGFVDVGANKNSVVWALGGSIDANGDYAVYRYDGATGSGSCPTSTAGSRWLLTDGRARHIDVAVDGSPWVVTNSGKIYHRNGVSGSNPGGTSWTRFAGLASDIAVGPDEWGAFGSVYITGATGDNLNYLLNEQVPNTWYQTWSSSKGTSLSVGKDSLPWLVALDNNSWHRTP